MTVVAYVGNFEPEYSTENDVREGLATWGVEVVPLQENRVSEARILEVANSGQVDMLLWTSTWDRHRSDLLTDVTVPTATYHLDLFHGLRREGRRWPTNPMWGADHVFTPDGDHDTEWASMGVRHHWLPPGVRRTACKILHDPVNPTGRPVDVAFVGADGMRTPYHPEWPYRSDLVRRLREMCLRNGWSFANPGGTEPKIPRDDRLNAFYQTTGVIVGDSLCPSYRKSTYWSDRVYETLGRCGHLIMPRIDALQEQLPFLTMYDWNDFARLERLIRLSLEHDDHRNVIRNGLYERVRADHTYRWRACEIMETVL